MTKRYYNNMYESKTFKGINDELTAPVEEPEAPEAPVEEIEDKIEELEDEETVVEIPETKKEISGFVTGGLNLNVRKSPNGDIIKSIRTGDKVSIIDDSNPDWYKISSPIEGYVMRKFIKLI